MPRYDALLFDFDGVLADSEPLHWKCWRKILTPLGIDLSWDVYEAQCIGVSDRAMLETLGRMKEPPVPLDVLWPLYPEKKALFRAEAVEHPPVMGSTVEAIRALTGFQLAVVTSSGRSEVEPILQRSGLLPLMGTVVYGDDVKRLKPFPDPYLLAAERLGVTTPLVFEDSVAGLASAAGAGFAAIQVRKAQDLPELLRSLSAS